VNGSRTRFYRDKQNAKVLGVCAGVADYTGVNALWVRLATILLVLMGVGLIVPAYILVGMFAARKPAHLYLDGGEQRFWQGVRQSPARTAREVRARFRDIDRRLGEVETHFVGRNARLSAEIERLR
jgi:phage shock protein C